MIVAIIQVEGVRAIAKYRKMIPAGIIGAKVQFEYAAEIWQGLHKTVVFRAGQITKDVITDADEVTIPPEVVAKRNVALQVGVYGVDADGNLAIPTIWADLGTIRDATDPSGDTTTDPQLPVWAQLQAMIGNLENLDTEAKNNLVAAVNEAITKCGGTVDEAEIQRIVDDYLAANPPTVMETDPTVPDWAKQPSKPTYTAGEVGAMPSSRNLLDNSDFTNPVAQAGIGGNHGTQAYAADRWILDSGTVSYEAGVGLTLDGTIRQKLEFPPTGETSAFVGMASGSASISYADGEVTVISTGGVLKWTALYSGTYTDETMPEYQPKGYVADLFECQRYYIPFKAEMGDTPLGSGFIITPSYARLCVPLPVAMRTIPTVIVETMANLYINTPTRHCQVNSIAVSGITQSSVVIDAETVGEGAQALSPVNAAANLRSANAGFALSADL